MPPAERDALEAWLMAAPPRCAAFFAVTVTAGHVVALSGAFGIIVARRASQSQLDED
jgi:hypothetical protein